MTYKCSVIIAFYNKIDFLKLVLAGYERQSEKDFEIIIADDGSKSNIVDELQELIKNSNLTIRHIWHEDKGWRKNEMLNKALLATKSDYIIFTDGDCIPHKHFVLEHLKNKKENYCLTGRRVNLPENFSQKLIPKSVKNGYIEKKLFDLLLKNFFGEGNHVEQGFYLRNKTLRKFRNRKYRGILGCNVSIHKQDLVNINGFDERYKAPGYGEDSDIELRLNLNGVKILTLNNIAVQYHLYHKELPRMESNRQLFEELSAKKDYFTPCGLEKI